MIARAGIKRRGFTLLEVLIALSVTAILLPVLGTVFYQMLTVPPAESDHLMVANEVQFVSSWLVFDGQKADDFRIDNDAGFVRFSWTDYTTPPPGNESVPRWHLVVYSWNNTSSELTRSESVWNGSVMITSTNVTVARNIKSFNTTFDYDKGIEVTINDSRGKATKEETIYIAIHLYHRGSETGGLPWGPEAIYIGLSGTDQGFIHLQGSNNVINGPLHSDKNLVVNGNGNTVYGNVELVDDSCEQCENEDKLKIINGELIFNAVQLGIPRVDIGIFSEYTFNFPDSVNLNDEDVWAEPPLPPTQLQPGIYHCNGTLTLDRPYASGTVTFIADKIIINGGYCNLQAYQNDLLFWGTSTQGNAIDISNDPPGIFHGIMYAPDAAIRLDGDGLSGQYLSYATFTGALVAQNVNLFGDYWYISRW